MQIKKIVLVGFMAVILLSGCGTTVRSSVNREEKTQETGKVEKQSVTEKDADMNEKGNFTAESTIHDVINDSAFEGYGRLIFPVDMEIEDDLQLKDVSSILPWYSEVNTDKTVEIVNYMKNQVMDGKQIFYPIYSEEEMQEDPDKRDTGLFFFRGNAGAKTAITNAGGGFVYVAGIHDSFPHALELSKKGYNAFALIYRPGAQTACEDLARAIACLHENAENLQIDMTDYSLWGGSAGARMAAWLGSYGTAYFGEKDYPAPAAVIMQYTGLSQVTGMEPPTYACVGTSDGIASYRRMESYISQIQQNGTNAEIEVFRGLSHGFGLGEGTVAEGWIDNAVSFWEDNMSGAEAEEITPGSEEYRGFLLDNVLHSPDEGDIHYNVYIPDSYDGTKEYALYVTLPGYQGLYFQGVGENIRTEDFGFEAQAYISDMIIVAPQLNDWGQTSADQTIELTQYFLAHYKIDPSRVYINGYSGGGETLSLVLAKQPELYTAALMCSSQWDGAYEPLVEAETPVYFVIGEDDEYYGSGPFKEAYQEIYDLYKAQGLSEEEIAKLVVLDIKDKEYFEGTPVTYQHGGGYLFCRDKEIMGWLFEH